MKGPDAATNAQHAYGPAVDDGEGGSLFSPGGSFQDYPGAVLLVGHNGIVLASNALGEPIGALLRGEGHGELRHAIRAALRGATTQVNPLILEIDDCDQGVGHCYDIVALPWAHGAAALLLGRDITLERSLRAALVESRQRFKDLVDLATEFAWECDRDGRFTYLSREVVLGHLADDLLGREARSIMLKGRNAAPSPFITQKDRVDGEVWLSCADQGSACLAVTAVPIFDDKGQWLGSRGFCRDVTAIRQHQTEAAEAQYRERLLAYVLQTVRDQLDPKAMLDAATDALLLAVGARGVTFYRLDPEHGFEAQSRSGEDLPAAVERNLFASASSDESFEVTREEINVLAYLTRAQDAENGLLTLWRHADEQPWRDEERELIQEAAKEIGVTGAQLSRERHLRRLSESDSLTGLLNRRGFLARLDEILERGASQADGTLFYIDIDDFKLVNDEAGHEMGDQLLVALAEVLRDQVRKADMLGRLGGDEFVLYLDGIDGKSAAVKAENILTAWRQRATAFMDRSCEVGLSIGLALVDGRTKESAQALIDRADQAMYRVKRAGKNGFLVSRTLSEDEIEAR